ncbi:MAG: 4-(cytidine 5'-diphospho)-2-C-methyl-D-erythritol kinase [Lachnospiraceae bacterium]|nr:4-(cytidine 5'-diphospho)-2-C-methyl-D-erythritol kinase [Lachnospiraceae bacterium]
MIYKARAKVNLTLEVTGRRDDGWHMLDTVFAPLSLEDRIFAERLPSGLAFSCSDKALETESNLAVRAFRLMQARFGFAGGLSLHLEKKVPSQAGLGGGSGDAACVLKICNELFGLGLTKAQLAETGAKLGADVPALVYDGPTRGRGTGTEVAPIPTALSLPLLIVKPPVGLSTPAMYRKLDEMGLGGNAAAEHAAQENGPAQSRSSLAEAALRAGDAAALKAQLWNVFDAAADGEEITLCRQALLRAGAEKAVLCGSGSASFGVFPDAAGRDEAAEKLRRKLPDSWQVFVADTVNEEENDG